MKPPGYLAQPRLIAYALATLALVLPEAAQAQSVPDRLTVMAPMRDGVRLATDIYLPPGEGPWPAALIRTPYDRRTLREHTSIPLARFRESGIAVVAQDVRGRFASEGLALFIGDDGWGERQDGADTVGWIRRQPWSNGRVATFGGSYPGHTQLALAGAGPEGIVGQHIATAPHSPYLYFPFRSGVLMPGAEGWMRDIFPDSVATIRQHPPYGAFWRALDFDTRLEHVRWPAVHVGGWFDLFSQSTLDAFTLLQERGGEGARGRQHLVIGPWDHSIASGTFPRQVSVLRFPANAGYPAGAPDQLQWLSFWLKGEPVVPADEPAVRYYVMGDVSDASAPGNVWRTASSWPPASRPLRLYFTAEGGLAEQPPTQSAVREYDYDPARPFRGTDGLDQRPAERRSDALVFSTPPLAEPLEVTGRIAVRLFAATSARDTDFIATLTDVYPNGRSIWLADGIVRARFRRSPGIEEPITPGERTAYDIDLWSTSIVFNRGHRIRVTISSANAARFEPNPNTGGPWPFDRSVLPVVARQTITVGGTDASHVILPEVP